MSEISKAARDRWRGLYDKYRMLVDTEWQTAAEASEDQQLATAAARQAFHAMPALLDALDAAEAENARLREALTEIREAAYSAIRRAENGGDVHDIHRVEYKVLSDVWRDAVNVIGMRMPKDADE